MFAVAVLQSLLGRRLLDMEHLLFPDDHHFVVDEGNFWQLHMILEQCLEATAAKVC